MRIAPFLCLPLLCLLALPAFADRIDDIFRVWDANADGILSKEEIPDASIFAQIDKDADGKITRAEVEAFVGGVKPATPPAEAAPKKKKSKSDGGVAKRPRTLKERVADFFRRLDRNQDGRIQAGEFPFGEEPFKKYDRTRDGTLSRREVTRYIKETLAAARRAPRPENFFDLFDRNDDGKVTKREYDGPGEFFRRYDHDKSGSVTREEINMGPNAGRMQRGDEDFMADGPTRIAKSGLLPRYDKNGDGRITLKELKGAESVLHRLDKNGDGVLSGSEVR